MAQVLSLKNGIPLTTNVTVGTAYDAYSTLSVDLSGNFTLPNSQTYNLGNNELIVWVDGLAQITGLDYTEANTTQITFLKTVKAGQTIRVRR